MTYSILVPAHPPTSISSVSMVVISSFKGVLQSVSRNMGLWPKRKQAPGLAAFRNRGKHVQFKQCQKSGLVFYEQNCTLFSQTAATIITSTRHINHSKHFKFGLTGDTKSILILQLTEAQPVRHNPQLLFNIPYQDQLSHPMNSM